MPRTLSQEIAPAGNLQPQSGHVVETGNVGGIFENLAGSKRQPGIGGRRGLLRFSRQVGFCGRGFCGFFRRGSFVESRRLRRYNLGRGLLPARVQPVKRPRGATQRGQCCEANCRFAAHAVCVTLPGIKRLPTGLPSYNVFLSAETSRRPSPARRELRAYQNADRASLPGSSHAALATRGWQVQSLAA
jgi:hypothetical protein